MRRLLAVSLLLSPLVLSAGCKKSETDKTADGKTIIRFLANPDVGGFSKEIIKNFERDNPGIKVEMVEGPAAPDTREDMYATSFMSREDTYDVVYMDLAWLPKFAAQGWLRPLDDWFTPEMQKQFLPGDVAGSKFDGKLYRLPVQSDGGLLYYRKDLLSQKGIKPPQTWAELLAAAKKLQNPPELNGFIFEGKQYEGLVCCFLELVWGNGGDLLDSKGNVVIDQPKAVEALKWLVDAVHTDKISPEGVLTFQEEEARHAFQEGKAVFMRNWPYAWNLMQDDASPVKGKVGIIPMVHGAGGSGAATLGGWGFGVSAFSRHPQEAWKVASYFATVDSEKLAYMHGGILPTRKSLFEDPDVLKKSPQIKDLYKVLSLTRPRPMVPSYARISDALQLHVSAALSNQEEPAAALKAAADEIRQALAVSKPQS